MAAPDGSGDSPGPNPRRQSQDGWTERPEAFGRGEHAEPRGGDSPQADADHKQPHQGDAEKKDERPFWKRPILMIVLCTVLLLGAIGGAYLAYEGYHYQSTDDAFIDGRIVRVAPRVAGKVLRLNVDDNVDVDANTVLVEIDEQPFQVKKDQQDAAEKQAEAQQALAEAQLMVSEAMAAQSDADVTVAQANARNAEQDFQRFQRVSKEARSQQQLDSATATQRATAATVIAQQKRADSAHAQVKAAQTTVNAAIASVNAAKSQVAQAVLDLSYCKVVAGHAGRVTRREVEVGNYVAVGQEIVDVVPASVPDIWVTANFKESQLAHMRVGQSVSISVDAFPDQKLRGHVDSIQNGTGAVFSLLPAENATGNYVKVVQRIPVKIVFDEKPRHLLSPGLSVVPEVDLGDRRSPNVADTAARAGDPTTQPSVD